MKIISIRTKILVIVLGFFSLIAAAFAAYSVITTENYRTLRIDEITKTVAFESERVGKVIAEMERNAVDLALAGEQFYRAGDYSAALGESIAVEYFSAFRTPVGGGIWFEPYALREDTLRVCYYAFYDPDIVTVRHDPEFESEEYDYHTQSWYTEIAANLNDRYATVWTAPYYETIGTNSLMTTVGAGIYDDSGRFIGMSTVDWQIQSMVDRLSFIRPTENSFVLLASPKDDYIISNTYNRGTGDVGASLDTLQWHNELHFSDDDNVDIGSFIEGGVEYISFSRLFPNGWLFSVQIPSTEIFAEIETRNNQFTIVIAGSFFVLLILTAYLLSRLIGRPLRKLTSGVAELGGGNLDKQLEIHSKDEIGALALAFNKMTIDLKESIEQSARERAEKERIGAELNVATQIQASMLPCIFPAFPDCAEFDIYASMLPAKEVGGDFYDFFLVDESTLAVVIADVSGKGVPAALFMVIAKTLIKNYAQMGMSASEVFTQANNQLCEGNEAGMFVTAFMGILDIKTGEFNYVNAGHNPPCMKKANGDFEFVKIKAGFVLAGMENVKYREGSVKLDKGDTLYLYTDGVTEATDINNELFSEPRLISSLNKYKNGSLQDLLTEVKNDIDKFVDKAPQFDDITMLAVTYEGGTKL